MATLSIDDTDIAGHGETQRGIDVNVDGDIPGGLRPTDSWAQPWEFHDISKRTVAVDVTSHLTDAVALVSSVNQTTSHELARQIDAYDIQPNGDFSAYYSCYGYDIASLSSTTYLRADLSGGFLQHHLTTGLTINRTVLYYNEAPGAQTLGTLGNLYHPVYLPPPDPSLDAIAVYESMTRQWGGFLSDQADIGDRWHALIGLRWSRIAVTNSDPRDGTVYDHHDNHAATPMVGVLYDLTPRVSAYASYSQGLEVGGQAPNTATNANEVMPAIRSWQVEAGFKSALPDDIATIDGSVFVISKSSEYLNSANTYVQDGEERHTGAELMAKGRFWQPLELTAGVQYLHAVLVDTGDPASDGERPAGVPIWHGVLAADYTVHRVDGLHVTLGATYVGEREVVVPNAVTAPGYLRLDLGARYEARIGGNAVIARLTVDNVANKVYYDSAYYYGVELGAPRTATASVEVKF